MFIHFTAAYYSHKLRTRIPACWRAENDDGRYYDALAADYDGLSMSEANERFKREAAEYFANN